MELHENRALHVREFN